MRYYNIDNTSRLYFNSRKKENADSILAAPRRPKTDAPPAQQTLSLAKTKLNPAPPIPVTKSMKTME